MDSGQNDIISHGGKVCFVLGWVSGCQRKEDLLMYNERRSKQRVHSPFLKLGQSSLGSICIWHITGKSQSAVLLSEYKRASSVDA